MKIHAPRAGAGTVTLAPVTSPIVTPAVGVMRMTAAQGAAVTMIAANARGKTTMDVTQADVNEAQARERRRLTIGLPAVNGAVMTTMGGILVEAGIVTRAAASHARARRVMMGTVSILALATLPGTVTTETLIADHLAGTPSAMSVLGAMTVTGAVIERGRRAAAKTTIALGRARGVTATT